MNLLINIFFLLSLTTLTGMLVQLIWILSIKFFGRRNPKAIYAGMCFVCLSYLIPIAYLLACKHFRSSFYYVEDGNDIMKLLGLTPGVKIALSVLAIIWLFLCVCVFYCHLFDYLEWRQRAKWERKEDSPEVLEKLDECRKRLSMKRRPKVYRKAGLSTPFCTGVFVKSILLPEREYRPEELEVIFMHEMTHIKAHDLDIKWIGILITMIHCFNPMAYQLLEQISVWSEIRCDICACEKSGGMFTIKQYYEIILSFIDGNNENKKSFIATALAESFHDITRRVRYVTDYKKTKERTKIATMAIMMAAMVAVSAVSYAAGIMFLNCYDRFTKNKFPICEVSIPFQEEERILNVDEKWNFVNMTEEVILSEEEKAGCLHKWTLESMDVYEIEQIYCEAGNKITVTCAVFEGSGGDIAIGIIGPDGTARSLKGKNAITHRFEIEESGYYRVFARNENPSEIKAKFSYYL